MMDMSKLNYHIYPRYDGTWLAVKDGERSVSVRARTLEEAVQRTVECARRWNAGVVLHHPDGHMERLAA
jgi:hypothetical protein